MSLQRQNGFTLVELMVAMALGLIIIGGATGAFLTSKAVYRQNAELARMQEGGRFINELLGRSLREAGGTPCGGVPVANVLNNPSNNWWSDWGDGLHGFENGRDKAGRDFPYPAGSNNYQRVEGTDALIVQRVADDNDSTIASHNPASAQFKLTQVNTGLTPGQIVMVCDPMQAAIFQITNANSHNRTVVHNTGNSQTPGNCSKGLGLPVKCTTLGTPHQFDKGGKLARMGSEAWYVGNNPRGGRSLYLATADGVDEVFEGVNDLQLRYLREGADRYVPANQIDDWTGVVAVRLQLQLKAADPSPSVGNIVRYWDMTLALRNRL